MYVTREIHVILFEFAYVSMIFFGIALSICISNIYDAYTYITLSFSLPVSLDI